MKSRRMRRAGHLGRMEKGFVFKIFASTSTGKRPFGRPRHRWGDNIRMNLKEIGINTRKCDY